MESLYFTPLKSIQGCTTWLNKISFSAIGTAKLKEDNTVHRLNTAYLVTFLVMFTLASPVLSQSNPQDSNTKLKLPANESIALANGMAETPTIDSAIPASNSRLRPSPKIENYLREIQEIEAENGPWSDSLSEQLGGLGAAYQARGQHNDAIEAFERAIHISRINNGLYDLGQVPMVESMIDSLLARNRREDAHDMFDYLYWLHKRSYGESDPQMLPVIDKLGNWYLNDYAHNPSQRHFSELLAARNMFDNADAIANAAYDENDLRLISPLRGVAVSSWFFANLNSHTLTSAIEKRRLENEIGPEINKRDFENMLSSGVVQGSGVYYPSNPELPNRLLRYIRTSYVDGKDALGRMIDIYSNNPESPLGAATIAKIELADWYLLHDSRSKAMDLYKEAYNAFLTDEATQPLAEKVFNHPAALPDLALVDSLIEQQGDDPEVFELEDSAKEIQYVLVSFNINRFGDVKKVDIIESHPSDAAGLRSRVKNALASTRFRPRFVDGEPVDTEGLVHKYIQTNN